MSEDLVVGRIYTVHHSRKGTFRAKLRVLRGSTVDGWAEVEIVEGEATLLGTLVTASAGEIISIKMSMSRFEAVR